MVIIFNQRSLVIYSKEHAWVPKNSLFRSETVLFCLIIVTDLLKTCFYNVETKWLNIYSSAI